MNTRERLMEATRRIIHERGIVAATTKDIARETGFSEATLYRHFADKTDLLLSALGEGIPDHFLRLIRDLPQRAGEGTVAENLEKLTAAATSFFHLTAPYNAALGADPALAAQHNARLAKSGAGHGYSLANLSEYLQAEQRLGRIRADISADAVATMLLGTSFNYALVRYLNGTHPLYPEEERFVREIVQTVMAALELPATTTH
jgi:AcrR family transcriptional regulator